MKRSRDGDAEKAAEFKTYDYPEVLVVRLGLEAPDARPCDRVTTRTHEGRTHLHGDKDCPQTPLSQVTQFEYTKTLILVRIMAQDTPPSLDPFQLGRHVKDERDRRGSIAKHWPLLIIRCCSLIHRDSHAGVEECKIAPLESHI